MTLFRTLLAAAAVFTLAVGSLFADIVTLKDGTVLEGEIVREIDGAIFLKMKVGGITHERLITRDRIESIERSEPADDSDGSDSSGKAGKSSTESSKSADQYSAAATRIAFITLEGTVGESMDAEALEKSVEMLEGHNVDIVVLQVNSGGGLLSEVSPLSDVIHEEIKPKYRVVGWVESAISAAAMTILTCEDVYMMSEGNIGGATAFSTDASGRTKAVEGVDLERILLLGERLARRGRHEPMVLRAMQVFMTLSCDINQDTGEITWYDNNQGRYIVSRENNILTFNSIEAEKYGIARGVADTKEELAEQLGVSEWIEVAPEADDYQEEFRENVARAKVAIQELMGKMQIAMEAERPNRARRYLGEIRSWVRRAQSLEIAMGLTPEWFRQQERRIEELREEQSRSRR